MLTRTSSVDSIHIDTVAFSSIIELGDSTIIEAFSRALALQRERELFFGNEVDFSTYSIFSKSIPFAPISERFFQWTDNRLSSIIKVNNINIIGISASAILHIGNCQSVQMEARIKHIRHLEDLD